MSASRVHTAFPASTVHTGFVFIGFYWVFEASGFRFLAFKVAVRGFEGACTFEAARAPWKRRVDLGSGAPQGPLGVRPSKAHTGFRVRVFGLRV